MTIHRLSFKEGYPIELRAPIKEQVAKAVEKHVDKIQQVPEGEYDLTPQWGSGAFKHQLTVLENGEGLYRTIPDGNDDAGMVDHNNEFRKGGNLIQLPQESRFSSVIASSSDLKGVALYEVVLFTPGPSPKASSTGEL